QWRHQPIPSELAAVIASPQRAGSGFATRHTGRTSAGLLAMRVGHVPPAEHAADRGNTRDLARADCAINDHLLPARVGKLADLTDSARRRQSPHRLPVASKPHDLIIWDAKIDADHRLSRPLRELPRPLMRERVAG